MTLLTDDELDAMRAAIAEAAGWPGTPFAKVERAKVATDALIAEVRRANERVREAYRLGKNHGIWGEPDDELVLP